MATRRPYVGGNWKMNLHAAEAQPLSESLVGQLDKSAGQAVDVVICPAAPYLDQVGRIVVGGSVLLGAQNFYHEANGAFTGEISLSMLQDVGVKVVLAGHSERRHVIGEPDTLINEKVLASLEAGMEVILCIGETLEQRESGKTNAINWGQAAYGLAGVSAEQMSMVTIAYEPVWAIGTGKNAKPQDAQDAHAAIRAFVRFGLFNDAVADAIRIQYGGSVKPANAAELIAQPDIDGFLVGGASLKADDFVAIVEQAAE